MSRDERRPDAGLQERESELQPLLQKLDALAAAMLALAESNAMLADAIAGEPPEEPQERDDGEVGGYIG